MSGLEHIYRNADKGDSLNVVLDNKSICKMIKKIKQQGYSVTVSEDYSNMENYSKKILYVELNPEK
jgi:TusA-related sulfurtransferase